ncbi:hypothetical protein FB00_11295 [Cellulosimicrobium funkei]|uniref:Uncharacterized protein n=1 Tax=Cellulosimicrobium funkei TaxID=264251 RepID=A0A0H2KN66_9MICO|nr:hypothetical protein [Cellulosimicrobium funkei]KLN34583.1 hypothetical protein FB00_11295 [Cellulosimicrobium funkei]
MTDTENTPPSVDKILRRFVKADRRLKRRIAKLNKAHDEWVEARDALKASSTTLEVGSNTTPALVTGGIAPVAVTIPQTTPDITSKEKFYRELAERYTTSE